jgi:hypothetical protein
MRASSSYSIGQPGDSRGRLRRSARRTRAALTFQIAAR